MNTSLSTWIQNYEHKSCRPTKNYRNCHSVILRHTSYPLQSIALPLSEGNYNVSHHQHALKVFSTCSFEQSLRGLFIAVAVLEFVLRLHLMAELGMLYRIFIFTILLYTVLYLVLFISRFQDPRHRVQFPALRVATRRLCRYATFWVQWNHIAPCSEKWSTVAEMYEKRQTIVPTSPFPHQMHPVLAKRQKREMCQLCPALLIVHYPHPSHSTVQDGYIVIELHSLC